MRNVLDDLEFIQNEIERLKSKIAQGGGGSAAPLPPGTIVEADFEPLLERLAFYRAAMKETVVTHETDVFPEEEEEKNAAPEKEKKGLASKRHKK